jgi:DNA polymerase I
MKPRIFLFDAYALIYRAYYAFINRPMINSKGQNTSAIYGFTSTLFDILKKENPEYVAVAFDAPARTFRSDLYEEYKSNRLITPEEIKKAVPIIKDILAALHIHVYEVVGFEADDIIGTIAKKAEEKGFKAFMVTPDKDYTQLVSENINIYKPSSAGKGYDVLGVDEVKARFGIQAPPQVIDILALWGDASDHIPGAPGIGEKTAKELIARFGSLEELYNHISELKPKQQESLLANKPQVMLSQVLATIVTNVPVEFDEELLKTNKWDEKRLREIFTDMEFRTFISVLNEARANPVQGSLFDAATTPGQPALETYLTAATVPHQYKLVKEPQELDDLVKLLSQQVAFCFDSETTGLQTRDAQLVGLSFSFVAHEAFYIPFTADQQETAVKLERLKPVFGNPAIKKIGQNLKYDIEILMNYGVNVEGELFDTMIAHYLIQPDLSHNMNYLAEVYLNYQPISIEELIGKKGNGQINMRDVEINLIKEYAAEDADVTWQLYPVLQKELDRMGLLPLAEAIEMPLVKVLAELEYAGFKISVDNLKSYASVLKEDIHACEQIIYEMAGVSFNISSPRQLGEILFERMKISEGAQKTKTKQYSTGEEILTKLVDKHPIISKILDYRAMQKLLNTYVEALPGLIDPKTSKIHTSFEQAWVSTGRLSSKNPNLQNIPIRYERGKEIRKAFIPSDDKHILLSADYSQIELRLMAHLSGDANMILAFRNQEDIHTATAAKIFKVEEKDVTSSMRSRAKTANFGIIYGISAFGLSQRLNISRGEAADLIKGYFETYPKVREYMENAIVMAKEKGYVETLLGRRRFLPDILSANAIVRGVAERNAINAPIQGSAADVIKQAMVNIQKRLRKYSHSHMILQVHDELIFDILDKEVNEIRDIVRYEMENALKLTVPLVVDIGTGNNWLEAH